MVTYGRGVDDGDDTVFRALADPNRRALLDELFREDGQALTALEQQFGITRFGVMKHLAVLEAAGLVRSRRSGRTKLHTLCTRPLRAVSERWPLPPEETR